MSPTDLLIKTAENLEAEPDNGISLPNRMMFVLKPAVPYGDIRKHLVTTARQMAEYHPPGMAGVCTNYRGMEMIEAADDFVTRRYGQHGAPSALSRWCRHAAESRAFGPEGLRASRPLAMPFMQPQTIAAT